MIYYVLESCFIAILPIYAILYAFEFLETFFRIFPVHCPIYCLPAIRCYNEVLKLSQQFNHRTSSFSEHKKYSYFLDVWKSFLSGTSGPSLYIMFILIKISI